MPQTPLVAAVKARDLAALKKELASTEAIPAQAMVEAGRLAWMPGLTTLVKAGGDLNASWRNYRPIHALIQEKPHDDGASTPLRLTCLEWMLEHGADPETRGAWPAARAIVIAAFSGDPMYVRTLEAKGARVDVFAAAALGHKDRLSSFLARDRTLAHERDGDDGLTALQCCGGSRLGATASTLAQSLLDCARLLVGAGADVNATAKSWGHDVDVAYFVIRSGQVDTLTHLLKHGLRATSGLSTAAWDNREDIVDLLIAHGAKINEAIDHGKPLVNELVRWGQFRLARMVLSKGASPNIPDPRGWTAVHQAVSRGNLDMLRDVIAAGGNPAMRDHSGKTPLDMAGGTRDLVKILKGKRSGTAHDGQP